MATQPQVQPKTPATNTGTTEVTKATELSKDEKAATLKKYGGTISGAIRGLHADGKSRADIAKMLGKRYQHVRNVLITPVKQPRQAETPAVATQTK